MGLFGAQDELFEVMARVRERERQRAEGGGTTAAVGELLELNGDALVVVDDGWEEEQAAAAGTSVRVRKDTVIVGGLLVAGLLGTAFLLGRTRDPAPPPPLALVAPATVTTAPDPTPTPQSGGGPVAGGPSASATPDVQARSDLPAGGGAPAPDGGAPTSQGTGAPGADVRAETPPPPPPEPEARRPADGRFEIQVCTTTAEKADAVARWFNEAPRSPLFGRGDLQAYVRGGRSVRIRGFQRCEEEVLDRVKATADPTAGRGGGAFRDATFYSVRADASR